MANCKTSLHRGGHILFFIYFLLISGWKTGGPSRRSKFRTDWKLDRRVEDQKRRSGKRSRASFKKEIS